ncbi:MAG: hypothetical protein ACLFPQ_02360 [Candidatus Woesearchaeota archaeon]
MESPIIGMVLFLLLMFAMAHLVFIGTGQIYTMKTSVDSRVIDDTKKNSEISIIGIECSYDHNLNTTNILVNNTGKEKLHLKRIDLYYPERVPRNESNRTMNITKETDLIDPGLWNPKEILNITIFKKLTNLSENMFIVVNEYGSSAKTKCNSTFG